MNQTLLSCVAKQLTVQVTPSKSALSQVTQRLNQLERDLVPTATDATLHFQCQSLQSVESSLTPNKFAQSVQAHRPTTKVQQRMRDRLCQIEAARQKLAEALEILQDLI